MTKGVVSVAEARRLIEAARVQRPSRPQPALPTFAEPAVSRPAKPGRGLRRQPGVMNKTEALRAEELDAMRDRGEILRYWYEGFTFKLAADTRYTPDFVVQMSDGLLVVEEVKGHWEDDALVKIKVAASLFPFTFVALTKRAKKDGGGWGRREFKGWTDE